MGISTHLLDASLGRPAADVAVTLDRLEKGGWTRLTERLSDADGRAPDLLPRDTPPPAGLYRLRFAVGEYFKRIGTTGLFPTVDVHFEMREGEQHYHLPLLFTANSYTTYRGS